jgi:hypothetical protein
MAVSDYTYGTVVGLQVKAGWVVSSRTFTVSTVPSTSEVEGVLDNIASEIHMRLAKHGYPVYTKAVVVASAPRVATFLGQLNELGAAAELIQTYAIAGDPTDGSRPSGYWKDQFKQGLEQIASGALDYLGLTRERALSSNLVGTWVEDENGNEKKPLFKRNMFDVPGDEFDDLDDE